MTMQLQQHTAGCAAATWRSHCFRNLCRVGPQTAFSSHTPSCQEPRALYTHRSSRRHARKRNAAGAKQRTVTCQAQEPVAEQLSMTVGDTQVRNGMCTSANLQYTLCWAGNRANPALQMTLATGEIGRQANGSVTLTYGETVGLHIHALFAVYGSVTAMHMTYMLPLGSTIASIVLARPLCLLAWQLF